MNKDPHVRLTLDEALDIRNALSSAAYALETVAHLRGCERELLPVAKKAREQQAIFNRIIYGPKAFKEPQA